MGLASYFLIAVLGGWLQIAPTLNRLLVMHQAYAAMGPIVAYAALTLIVIVLLLGSIRTLRWSFWGYVVLLALFAVSAIGRGPLRTPFEWFLDPVGLVLLVLSLIGLLRFGPWALKGESVMRPA
jgi:hypothetical protein